MAEAIQVKVKAIGRAGTARKILAEFRSYMNRYCELERESTRIPRWRHFKQFKNMRKREKLTRDFKVKMFDLNVLV